jgi:hypothetical protein
MIQKRFNVKNIERNKVLLILTWCMTKFGKARYRKFPKLRVYKSKGTNVDFTSPDGVFGIFRNNTIEIFLGGHSNIEELCHTVVHEYKHYLIGLKYYFINRHPHEIRARRFETKWGNVCYKELKNKLYK